MNTRIDQHSPEEWDAWLSAQPHASVFQSWGWKEFQESAGREVHTISLEDEGSGAIIAQMLLIRATLPLKAWYLFAPRGPVIAQEYLQSDNASNAQLNTLITQCVQAVADAFSGAAFVRLEPAQQFTLSSHEEGVVLHNATDALHHAGGVRVHDMQPAATRILDLQNSGEELLATMKQKTRYNIRYAQKKGVQTAWVDVTSLSSEQREEYTQQWIALQNATAQRHHIRTHGDAYYRAWFYTRWPKDRVFVAVAHDSEGEILSMNILTAFGDTLTYLYGASSDHKKNLMAPYALQWLAIEEGQKRGLRWYDLYGIAPTDASKDHQLFGVTRFKEGFSGAEYQSVGTWEFAISRLWYTMYRIAKQLRK